MTKFPCLICKKVVARNHNALCCDSCNLWVHIKCNNISKKCYNTLKRDSNPWFCKNCIKKAIPFSSINDTELKLHINEKSGTKDKVVPLSVLENLNTFLEHENNQCRYYSHDEFKAIENITNDKSALSIMHLNISSLPYHFDELTEMLRDFNYCFNIIALTESKLKYNTETSTKIEIENYNIEHTPTDSSKGGALLYLHKDLNYKKRHDLKIQKQKELESIFVEIVSNKKKNTIIGCIYKHPNMSVKEFVEDYMELLCEKLSHENRQVAKAHMLSHRTYFVFLP